MKNHYTKEQISEALSYWARQLKLMTESYNNCVDALINEFGNDLVTSNDRTYNLSKEDLKRMYDVLNFTLFDNDLGFIRLEHWPEKLIVEKLNENNEKSGILDKKIHRLPAAGVFTGVCKDVIGKDGDIVDIDIYEEIIMLNKDYMSDCIFIFAVAALCHEMIHFYDRFTKEFHDKQLKASQTKEDFDSHKDQIFQEMMKEANRKGIHVVESLEGIPFKLANSNARYVLKNVIGEDEDCSTFVNANDFRYTMRADGSHSFVFAEFD